MQDWDAEKKSRYYLQISETTEDYLDEIMRKVATNPSYERVIDETLGKFFVYNYLHGKVFLSSKEKLLQELKEMLSQEVDHREAFDKRRFNEARENVIRHEIAQLESSKCL